MKHALAEGLRTIMRKTPFDNISVVDICNESAVSRRSFYRYFKDKYELLNWTYYDAFLYMFDDKKTPHAISLYPHVCRHLYLDREFYLNAFDVKGQNSFREYCTERLYPYLERDYGDACMTEKERKFYITRLIDAVFDNLQEWLRTEPCVPPDEYVEKAVRSITRMSVRLASVALTVSEQMGL